jgi:hypothetical protein
LSPAAVRMRRLNRPSRDTRLHFLHHFLS